MYRAPTLSLAPMHVRAVSAALATPGAALLVHGGAWDIPDDALADHRDGLAIAVDTGRQWLADGASAVDVAVEVVAAMEAHGAFDAGRGSVLDIDGAVSVDAAVVCGATARWGAVAALRHVAAPSRLARWLLGAAPSEARLLVGEGAERFAAAAGVALVDPASLVHPRERARYAAALAAAPSAQTPGPRGTVGCLVRDAAGRLAACTSTGGTPMKPAGRVGDSPLVGAGVYADAHAAVSSTGWGEALVATCAAVRAADAVAGGASPESAIRARLDAVARFCTADGEAGTAGLIVLGATGAGAWGFTTPRMARAGWHEGGEGWLMI